jgi:hypothetical protein
MPDIRRLQHQLVPSNTDAGDGKPDLYDSFSSHA